ncbi:MAG: aminotransferase class V-fold PLP-dependent enzyme [Actinobacteria bacterium]|nr:aminotransferase class V-fold PLP-dependent enzyme [Actinomycetota bacterium]MCB8995686.1 aminotransferase class V-fold PLP-dependent enzyme [Actinomycetota bacterium]HRY11412.1 aminotransferase class V-fold PLP-dependent enzyme [Candidatus Nanopelagicales bacterium]
MQPTAREAAQALDAADPLADYRNRFHVGDPEVCYLDGNSLGRLPHATAPAINELLTEEWGDELVDGWSHWIDEAQTTGDLLGRAALGAAPGQVLVQDTTSVNFYQLCVAAVAARPGRRRVIIDAANFPTDRYILAGIARSMDLDLVILDNDGTGGVPTSSDDERISPDELAKHIDDDTALVALQVVQYRSGARQDVAALTALARSHGALTVWDASHAVGSIDLRFDEWGVDLAVGCTYKYGNSGPGAPAWLYVNASRQAELRVPVQGWFANREQFAMGPVFDPADGIRRFQIATPPILGLRAVQVAFGMIEQAGMSAIGEKAQRGTELMIALYDAWLAPLGFSLLSPRDPHQRGGHVTIGHPEAKQIAAAMRVLTRTIPDYRAPDSIRLAISPLPTSYTEVWDGLDRLRALVESGAYREVDPTSRVT